MDSFDYPQEMLDVYAALPEGGKRSVDHVRNILHTAAVRFCGIIASAYSAEDDDAGERLTIEGDQVLVEFMAAMDALTEKSRDIIAGDMMKKHREGEMA